MLKKVLAVCQGFRQSVTMPFTCEVTAPTFKSSERGSAQHQFCSIVCKTIHITSDKRLTSKIIAIVYYKSVHI